MTITHDLNEVLFADRVIVMNNGQVMFEGKPREIFEKQQELEKIGLDTPFVNKLSQELEKEGLSFSTLPLTHKELMDELWKYHLNT